MGRDHALHALVLTVHRGISGLNTLSERALDPNHCFAHVQTDDCREMRTLWARGHSVLQLTRGRVRLQLALLYTNGPSQLQSFGVGTAR